MRNVQSGRRRGRGNNPRPQQGGREAGNRSMEPRQRGNAVQLLEKYNNLAREAHQQGERVQAEYYMQYADHYHRVVAEMRARQEERQPQQQNDRQGGRDREDRYEREGRDNRDERDEADDRDDQEDSDGRDYDDAEDSAALEVRAEPVDEGHDEGALRTLSRSARRPNGEDSFAEDRPVAETRSDDDRPRRGRGRPRRAPRDATDNSTDREPVDA
jgi:hypothetical protein